MMPYLVEEMEALSPEDQEDFDKIISELSKFGTEQLCLAKMLGLTIEEREFHLANADAAFDSIKDMRRQLREIEDPAYVTDEQLLQKWATPPKIIKLANSLTPEQKQRAIQAQTISNRRDQERRKKASYRLDHEETRKPRPARTRKTTEYSQWVLKPTA